MKKLNEQNNQPVQSDALVQRGDWQALERAVAEGELDVVTRLMKESSHVKERMDGHCHELLCLAIEKQHVALSHYLIDFMERGQGLAAQNNKALTQAVWAGDLQIFDRLLGAKEVQDIVACDNNFAFMIAAQKGRLHCVNELLAFEKVRSHVQKYERDWLNAVANGHVRVVQKMLDHCRVEQRLLVKLICQALRSRAHDMLDFLRECYDLSKNQGREESSAARKDQDMGEFLVDVFLENENNRRLSITPSDDSESNNRQELLKLLLLKHMTKELPKFVESCIQSYWYAPSFYEEHVVDLIYDHQLHRQTHHDGMCDTLHSNARSSLSLK